MWQITFFLFAVSFCIFAGVMIHDSRTLWSGISFFWMMVCLAVAMLFLLAGYLEWFSSHAAVKWLLIILMLAAAGCVLVFPMVLIITFFVEGIKVIRHEGIKPANMLSMAFSVMLFGYLAVWPAFGRAGSGLLGARLYVLISLLAFYLLYLFPFRGAEPDSSEKETKG